MKILLLTPEENAVLSIPDSAIVKNGNPFFIPDFDPEFRAYFFLAVKICRLGKSISPRFAHRYYAEAAPAINIRANTLLHELREKRLPWTEATAFDKSLPLGKFLPVETLRNKPLLLTISSHEGENLTLPMILPEENEIARAIERISRYNSLKMGDLILLPFSFATPSPLSPVLEIDSIITVKNDGTSLLELPVR